MLLVLARYKNPSMSKSCLVAATHVAGIVVQDFLIILQGQGMKSLMSSNLGMKRFFDNPATHVAGILCCFRTPI